MSQLIRPLLFLLAVSTILLVSDLPNRKGFIRREGVTRLAVLRFNSNEILEETENGLLDVLESSEEFRNGRIELRRYSAEGDMPTANTIARSIVNGHFDMVVSISTPGLQVMANANQDGKLVHVFCAVTDPVAAGVGITGPGAHQHPPHLAGIGTFQPVESIIRIARQMNPSLRKLGVAWCASEVCSEACVRLARSVCRDLDIELEEMSIEAATQVYEAALAVSSRGVDALWIGGDNLVETAIEMYVAAASRYNIPVFTNNPGHAFKGALANLGANYYQVGEAAAAMALSVLNGRKTAEIETVNYVPERLFINDSVRQRFSDKWSIPAELMPRIDSLVR